MATKIIQIDRFEGGVADSPRSGAANQFNLSKHFDIFTEPRALVPYRDMEDDDTASSDNFEVTSFLYIGTQMYGLGVVDGTARVKIYKKASDSPTALWEELSASGSEDGAGARVPAVFAYYQDDFFGWTAGNRLWKVSDFDGTPSWTGTYQSITYTSVAQPLRHTNDDILYFPHDNKISKLDNTTFTEAALTLPDNVVITDLEEYGGYLAIACEPLNIGDKSYVYLWNRIDDDVTQVIDWGEGELKILANLEGALIGVSSTGGTTYSQEAKIVFREYAGGGRARVVKEVVSDNNTALIYNGSNTFRTKFIRNNNLYFGADIGTGYNSGEGIWVFGRKSRDYPWAVTLDRLVNNDTALTGNIEGLTFINDYMFVAYNGDGSMARNNDQDVYTSATAVWESLENHGMPAGDRAKKKQLSGVRVMFEYLPTAGQVVVEYKKDEDSSWTNLITEATDNELVAENVSVNPYFKEIQFRIESTGGAVITGFEYRYDEVDSPYG